MYNSCLVHFFINEIPHDTNIHFLTRLASWVFDCDCDRDQTNVLLIMHTWHSSLRHLLWTKHIWFWLLTAVNIFQTYTGKDCNKYHETELSTETFPLNPQPTTTWRWRLRTCWKVRQFLVSKVELHNLKDAIETVSFTERTISLSTGDDDTWNATPSRYKIKQLPVEQYGLLPSLLI